MIYRKCKKCEVNKVIELFPFRSNGLRRYECKTCTAKIAREYRKNNKDKIRIQKAMNAYDITEKEVVDLYLEENCGICSVKIKNQRSKHIDHCHETNRVRGVLCTNCNVGLGMFKDNEQNLLNAIKWIN